MEAVPIDWNCYQLFAGVVEAREKGMELGYEMLTSDVEIQSLHQQEQECFGEEGQECWH